MIVVYFDGLCEGNPGGVATYGFLVKRGGRAIHEGHGIAGKPYSPEATNNVAEYTGLVKALEWLADQNIREAIVVRGDSKLVIEQASGRWKVKSPLLAPLNARARELFFTFPSIKFEWVPREQNREADALTNLAYAEFQARAR